MVNKRNIKAFLKLTLLFTLIFSIISGMLIYIKLDLIDDGKLFGQSEIFGINLVQLFDVEDEVIDRNINVLMVGVDKGGTRTDVMILGNLNLDTQTITMVQLPRDTYVPNNGRYDKKLNSAYGAGLERMISEIEMVTGAEIDKFVKVDTAQFRNIVDAMGGVWFDVPRNMNYDDPAQDLHIHLEKGYQLLNGDQAEQFVRFRQNNNGSGYARGDLERLEEQQGFIKATIDQLLDTKNATKIPELASIFFDMIETDFSNAELVAYATKIFDIPNENISILSLEGETRDINGGSYFIPYESKKQELIEAYFYNE